MLSKHGDEITYKGGDGIQYSGGLATPDNLEMIYPTSFDGEYTLAKKP